MKKFQGRDVDLVKFDTSERAMMARLAMYLQNELGHGKVALDVDCEYNRQSRGDRMPLETTVWIPKPDDQPAVGMDIERTAAVIYKPMRVFPDIGVHRRGDIAANVLVIEIKKSAQPRMLSIANASRSSPCPGPRKASDISSAFYLSFGSVVERSRSRQAGSRTARTSILAASPAHIRNDREECDLSTAFDGAGTDKADGGTAGSSTICELEKRTTRYS
jgi:hypothetical protein